MASMRPLVPYKHIISVLHSDMLPLEKIRQLFVPLCGWQIGLWPMPDISMALTGRSNGLQVMRITTCSSAYRKWKNQHSVIDHLVRQAPTKQ